MNPACIKTCILSKVSLTHFVCCSAARLLAELELEDKKAAEDKKAQREKTQREKAAAGAAGVQQGQQASTSSPPAKRNAKGE